MKSQAIVAYGKPLEEVTSDIPAPKGTEVVVKITHSGVCHSDVHLQDGHVDLGDGDKIDWSKGRTLPLAPGDKVAIGSQEMILNLAAEVHPTAAANEDVYRRATQTLGAAYVVDLRAAVAEASSAGVAPSSDRPSDRASDPPSAEASRSMQSFQLLGGVADKALALGRAEEAERILQSLLLDVLNRARDGGPQRLHVTSTRALRLALASGGRTQRSATRTGDAEPYRS